MRIYDTSTLIGQIRKGTSDLNAHILDLTIYEIGNVLYKRVKLLKDINEKEAHSIAVVVNQWTNVMCIGQEYISEIFDLACEINVSFYDSAYVFAAKKFDAELLTSDRKLYDKAKNKIKIKYLEPED
ncbi:type II toxin-antitoxin system VapC family toxin [Candidatus Micrarchaeota archaeon]|nr:type II toxin-antitoxin system VapC family toxin [Candidatus Micrarchaeota archaeon]